MRKPGQADTLVKIASLGGGGAAIGGHLQKTANRSRKMKKELEKAKRDDAAYRDKIKRMKIRHKGEKMHKGDLDKDGKMSSYEKKRSLAIEKAVAKKKRSKKTCPKCGGKGCSHCKGRGHHGK